MRGGIDGRGGRAALPLEAPETGYQRLRACLRAMTASQMEPLLEELDEQAGFARPKSKMPSADAARN